MNVKKYRIQWCLAAAVLFLGGIGAGWAASDSGDNSIPQDVFDGMRHSFQAQKARGVHARYQWELAGANGGEWWINVNDGTFQMGRGKIPDPSVTFITSARDWVAISNGKLSGKWAFVTGRLKVRGDRQLARKLDEIFP